MFEAVEMDLIIKAKLVTYHPATVIENQVKLMRKMNEALSAAGKELDLLPSPVSLTIQQGESK